jgi:ABC-type fe3+-hydroxamate transport system, periplasmic component
MEWIKLYGILLGKEALAEEVFARQAQRIAPLLEQPSTGKRCAFFSITSSGLATVRKSGDYVAQMIGMAGGEYVFADLADSGNSLSTMNIPLEDLYAGVKDADVLIYNGTIEGTISTKEELLARCALLAECKAVQCGDIWCTTPDFFQQSMALADFMLDLHAVFTGATADPDTLHFLTRIT